MTVSIWVVIPAAGSGSRMRDVTPKQYLPLAGRSVIEWAVAPFLARADVSGLMIAHAPNDQRLHDPALLNDGRVRRTVGGEHRAASVQNGVRALGAADEDWVLVHDAARPCLHDDDLARLIAELRDDAVGGLLACPVSETLKLADAHGSVQSTVPRERLWRAQTPQMFRAGLLLRALTAAHERGLVVTDESSAMESLGYKPKLVAGRSDNIKVTRPEDLAHAEFILRSRVS